MIQTEEKCVMIIDETLPRGLIANTAAILGITLGKLCPEMVGPDAVDGSGNAHPGIVTTPVPVLCGTPEELRSIRQKLCQPAFQDVTAVDFSRLAQGCRTYGEWIGKIAQVPESSLQYLGLALCGAKKKVNTLTGNIPLLR